MTGRRRRDDWQRKGERRRKEWERVESWVREWERITRERTEEEKEDGNRDESGSGGRVGRQTWDRWDHRVEMVSKEEPWTKGTRGERERERLIVEEGERGKENNDVEAENRGGNDSVPLLVPRLRSSQRTEDNADVPPLLSAVFSSHPALLLTSLCLCLSSSLPGQTTVSLSQFLPQMVRLSTRMIDLYQSVSCADSFE